MSRSKTYRNIAAKVKFFGLEVGDWGALAAVSGALFAISEVLSLNLGATIGLWLWLYRFKARKPEGYTSCLLTRLRSPRALHIAKEFNHDAKPD